MDLTVKDYFLKTKVLRKDKFVLLKKLMNWCVLPGEWERRIHLNYFKIERAHSSKLICNLPVYILLQG